MNFCLISRENGLPKLKNVKDVFIGADCKGKKYYKRVGFYITLLLVLSSLSGVIILFGTDLYDTAILKILTLKDGGMVFDVWKEPEQENTIYIYPFNYTNIDKIRTERPNVQELGPYVFKERSQKVNIVFNGNGTLTYSENRTHEFDPSLSNGTLNDIMYTPNLAFMTAAALGANKGMIAQLALATLLKGFDSRPFLPVNALNFISGFEDNFSAVARKMYSIFKGGSGPPKFGMLAERLGLSQNRITIGSGVPDLDNLGMISHFDGVSSLDYWKTEECNKIAGSDLSLFPSRHVQKLSKLYIYIPSYCRRLPLIYNGEMHKYTNFMAKRFELPQNIYSTPEENPENACFSEENQWLPSGVFSTSKCTFGTPVSYSYPHFLHGDKELLFNVTGLKPELEKHRFYMDIHFRFGVPLGGRMRIQLNVVVRHCNFLSQLNVIPDGTVLPVAWIDVSIGELKGFGKDILYHGTYTADYGKYALQWTSVVVILVTFVCLCKYLMYKQ